MKKYAVELTDEFLRTSFYNEATRIDFTSSFVN